MPGIILETGIEHLSKTKRLSLRNLHPKGEERNAQNR